MENIFENPYFGKSYKTRDGRKALLWYYHTGNNVVDQAVLITIGASQILVDGTGKDMNEPYNNTTNDIISEWQEEKTLEDVNSLINVAKEIAIEQKNISDYNRQKNIENVYKEVLSCLSYQIHNKNIVNGIIKIRTGDNYKKHLPYPDQGGLIGYCNWNLGYVWEHIGMKVAEIIRDKHHINCQFVDKGISDDSYFKINFN